MSAIPPEQWGKDHFSTLVDGRRMRSRTSGYPTILREGQQPEHGDMDCIEDMRAAGLVVGGERNTFAAHRDGEGPDPNIEPLTPFALTSQGWALAHFLRRRRGQGLTVLPTVATVLAVIER